MNVRAERTLDVRWRDVDALGHVNNAVFLTYLEEARDDFYLQVVQGVNYVVARIELDLTAEVRFGDRQVRVTIEAERVGRTSLTTRETITTAAGAIAAQARVITVRWDAAAHQPMPFTAAERSRLTGTGDGNGQ